MHLAKKAITKTVQRSLFSWTGGQRVTYELQKTIQAQNKNNSPCTKVSDKLSLLRILFCIPIYIYSSISTYMYTFIVIVHILFSMWRVCSCSNNMWYYGLYQYVHVRCPCCCVCVCGMLNRQYFCASREYAKTGVRAVYERSHSLHSQIN